MSYSVSNYNDGHFHHCQRFYSANDSLLANDVFAQYFFILCQVTMMVIFIIAKDFIMLVMLS